MNARLGRLTFLALLAVYGVVCLRSPGEGRLLDGIDLAIHETGHIVFSPFGQWLMVMGGTLFQLIVPATFVGYFVRRREAFSASVCLWWVAQNLWNISVYVADARAEELPLVGGGEHDWTYLLAHAGWLRHDIGIARAVHSSGVLIFLLALALGLAAVVRAPVAIAEAEVATR